MSEEFTKLLSDLRDASSDVSASALTDLSDLDDGEAGSLANRWPEIETGRRQWILRELIDLGEDNVELNFDRVYLQALSDDDAGVRRDSVRGLWEYERPDVIPRLVSLMEGDEDVAVRAEAAQALRHFVVATATGHLRDRHFEVIEEGVKRVLVNDTESIDVRTRALESIGAHDVAWVRQAISEAYESGDRRLKTSAVHAMGRSCESRWLALVTREMSNDEAEIRYEAAIAAGSLGGEAEVPRLVEMTGDEDGEVAQASVAALGEIGSVEARRALQEIVDGESEVLVEAAKAALADTGVEENPLSFGRPSAL